MDPIKKALWCIESRFTAPLSLDEIAEAMATLPAGRTPTKADWSRLSASWRARLDEQIRAIEKLRDNLDGCIGCGCLSLRKCRLYNPEDTWGERGPGPRVLR